MTRKRRKEEFGMNVLIRTRAVEKYLQRKRREFPGGLIKKAPALFGKNVMISFKNNSGQSLGKLPHVSKDSLEPIKFYYKPSNI